MFRHEIATAYRDVAVDAILRGGTRIGMQQAEADADAEARQRRLAAERAVDSVLADSFPASDPPSWTLGIAHPQPDHRATNTETVALTGRASPVQADVIDVSTPATDGRTFLTGLVSLAGAAGIALLVPFVIMLIGIATAVAVRGVVEAVRWLIGLIFG